VLKQLCDRRGLAIRPSRLGELVVASSGRSSSLINLSLTWSSADEGIANLNELTNIFIEEMAGQRKAILQQNLQHLEMALMQSKWRVDESHIEHVALRAQQRQQF